VALLVALVAGVGALAATAFACIPIAVLRLTPSEVAPGGTVNALIREVSGAEVPPVTFHWNAVDGPVLATVQPGDSATTATFQIPADAKGGDYVIWATQPQKVYPKGQFPTWGMPAKASIHVTTPAGPPALFGADAALQTQSRAAGLVAQSRSGLSAGAIAAIAVASAVIALAAVFLFTRRPARGSGPAAPAGSA
jgi:hypothetical protein